MKENNTPLVGIVIAVAIVILGALGVAFSGNQPAALEENSPAETEATMEGETMEKGEVMMEGEAVMQKGSYETYAPEKLAQANEGDVVLFFRASWCPTCRVLDKDIKEHMEAIPQGVTILDVNYDNSTDLKQKYGVTRQHTLVQVDANGNLIQKWDGSTTLGSLLTQIQ